MKKFRTKCPEIYASPAQEGWLDDDYVDRLAEDFRRGDDIPPIVIHEDGEIIEGHHRFAAAQKAGISIRAIIVPDAQFKAWRKEGMTLQDIEDEAIRHL